MSRLVAVLAALLMTGTVSQIPVQAESAPLMVADFKMTVADLVSLSRFVAEDPDAPELKIRPDVNCDGVVTMQDVAVASGWIAEAGTAYDWVFSNQQYWMPDYDRICSDVATRYGVAVSDLVGFSGYDRYDIWQAYGSSNICIEVCFSEVYDGDRGWCFTSQDPYFNGLGFEDEYYDGDMIMSVFVYDTEHWTDDGFSERWDVPVTRESHLLYDWGSHTFITN